MKKILKTYETPVKQFQVNHKEDNVFYNTFWIYWWILKILGILPFRYSSSGDLKFNWFSMELFYSIFAYLASLYPAYLLFINQFQVFLNYEGNFDEAMIMVICTLITCGSHFLVPWTHWVEMNAVEEVFIKWREFQDDFVETTGVPVPMLRRKRITIKFFLLALALSLFGLFGFKISLMKIEIWGCFVVNGIVIVSYLHFSLFIQNADCIILIVEEFKIHLRKVIKDRKYYLLSRYNVLWVRIAELCQAAGDIFHKVYGIILVALFILVTINCYSIVKLASDGFDPKRLFAVVPVGMFGFLIFSICERGHKISKHVGENFITELVESRNLSSNMELQEEMEIFIDCILVTPYKISYGGYVTIDRSLLISMISAMITYLVVVVQFTLN